MRGMPVEGRITFTFAENCDTGRAFRENFYMNLCSLSVVFCLSPYFLGIP